MSELESSQPTAEKTEETSKDNEINLLRLLSGAFISGTLGLLLYRLTSAIALKFATHPITSDNRIAHNLSAAVRTLVVGLATMATGVFALVAIGLIGLGIQITLQRLLKRNPAA